MHTYKDVKIKVIDEIAIFNSHYLEIDKIYDARLIVTSVLRFNVDGYAEIDRYYLIKTPTDGWAYANGIDNYRIEIDEAEVVG